MERKRHIIFDMGNVILPFDHMIACRAVGLVCGLDAETVYDRIFDGGLEQAFEEGRLNGSGFLAACADALGQQFSESSFIAMWCDIFEEDSQVVALIKRIKERGIGLILASNTNEWHFAHARRQFPVLSEFENLVLSYELGVCKPSEIVFRKALETVADVNSTLYVDDIAAYVAAANRLGIPGHVFRDASSLEEELSRGSFL